MLILHVVGDIVWGCAVAVSCHGVWMLVYDYCYNLDWMFAEICDFGEDKELCVSISKSFPI